MGKDIFRRMTENEDLSGVDLSDYKPYQLAAHVLKAYPGDPLGALKLLRDSYEIGFILYESTVALLEGSNYAKRDSGLYLISQ